mgnify:CR=1 FL=1
MDQLHCIGFCFDSFIQKYSWSSWYVIRLLEDINQGVYIYGESMKIGNVCNIVWGDQLKHFVTLQDFGVEGSTKFGNVP